MGMGLPGRLREVSRDMRTPLQRLQQFAAKNGEPVSFEIAEVAMKGGG